MASKERGIMPTYEYSCNICGERIMNVRGINETMENNNCPMDGCSGKLLQVYGNIAIGFKGEGFYTTDKKTSTKKAK
jgi:putative FmdB family regulatory protein